MNAEWLTTGAIVAATLAYMLAMALPFCPGIEVGLALLAVLGSRGAPLVYAATVIALLAAFAVGRMVPPPVITALLARTGMQRACMLLERLQGLDESARLSLLLAQAPPRLARWLLRHRYVALAIALNTPGNIALGDGGGIAFAAGLSRLYSFPRFALTVMLAVAPVPLAVVLGGSPWA